MLITKQYLIDLAVDRYNEITSKKILIKDCDIKCEYNIDNSEYAFTVYTSDNKNPIRIMLYCTYGTRFTAGRIKPRFSKPSLDWISDTNFEFSLDVEFTRTMFPLNTMFRLCASRKDVNLLVDEDGTPLLLDSLNSYILPDKK